MNPFEKTYRAGTHLFHENDRSRELYVIKKGDIEVYRRIGKRDVVLATIGAGSVLGEMALIDGKPRSASARARNDVNVVLIDADSFHKKIQGVPPWFLSIIKNTSQKIRKANNRLETIRNDNHLVQIALLVYYLMGSRKQAGAQAVGLSETKQTIMSLLGSSQGSILTVLEFLSAHGMIRLTDTTVDLVDEEKFRLYSYFLTLYKRNALQNLNSLSENLCSVIKRGVSEYDIPLDTGEHLETYISPAQLKSLIESCSLEEYSAELIEELRSRQFIQSRKNKESSNESESGAIVYLINNSEWRKAFLYTRFNNLLPDQA